MSEPPSIPGVPEGVRPPPTDPMKGARGIFAATLIIEAIAVLLALLVVDGSPVGFGVVLALALAMIVLSGLQRRPWGLTAAVVLQVLLVVAGFVFVPALGILGIVFVVVWGVLLWMRREVARRMAAGTLPSQQDG
ncbi:DUF4233 domain-containing protein [Pseudonocardia phyllosphaerae]|uniref:DUF4233 domain-containing protein n=1 Tax=Pseudonocardia phyllosphaerae TaxID=3390502 RepID=UPI00397D1505